MPPEVTRCHKNIAAIFAVVAFPEEKQAHLVPELTKRMSEKATKRKSRWFEPYQFHDV